MKSVIEKLIKKESLHSTLSKFFFLQNVIPLTFTFSSKIVCLTPTNTTLMCAYMAAFRTNSFLKKYISLNQVRKQSNSLWQTKLQIKDRLHNTIFIRYIIKINTAYFIYIGFELDSFTLLMFKKSRALVYRALMF